jgi:hypothetical protein
MTKQEQEMKLQYTLSNYFKAHQVKYQNKAEPIIIWKHRKQLAQTQHFTLNPAHAAWFQHSPVRCERNTANMILKSLNVNPEHKK